MRKLTLSLDSLAVESFVPAPRDPMLRGTIRAHDDTILCNTNENTCQGCYTINRTLCNPNEPCQGATLGTDPTCNNYTCFGETCPPMKGCIPPE